MNKVIYLDNGATTLVRKEVAKEMSRYLLTEYGNPSSPHEMGEKARKAIDDARTFLSKEINCKPGEIIFTSGATESNNIALFGLAKAYPNKKKIIISKIEHSSVYEPAMELRNQGYVVREMRVNEQGEINIDEIERKVDGNTLLVSIIHGNNEIGTIQDIKKIGEICKRKKVLFHTDAVQTFGKEKMDVKDVGIDLLSASAHKIGGPKGMGLLYVKDGVDLRPLFYGGSQEKKIRPGTENVAGIVGFAKALELLKKVDNNEIRKLRDYFMIEVERIGGKINGSREKRLANNINVSFSGIDAENLIEKLSQKGVMCSARSACLTKQKVENKVLKAIGLSEREMNGSLRFVLSDKVGKREIRDVLRIIKFFVTRQNDINL